MILGKKERNMKRESKMACAPVGKQPNIIIASDKNNPYFQQVHIRQKLILEGSNKQDYHLPLKRSSEKYIDGFLTKTGEKILRELATVDGINRIQVNLYCLNLHLSPVYNWHDEIEEKVVNIVKRPIDVLSNLIIRYTTIDKL